MTTAPINPMPHETSQRFLTDAGLETYMLFQKGLDLPCFAAFPLLKSDKGRAVMTEYFNEFLDMARQHNAGFILDTPTWRANPDWAEQLGLTLDGLADANREAVAFADELRRDANIGQPVLINGVVGPRGDGYDPEAIMSVAEAESYHGFQIDVLAQTRADMISAITMTNAPEATGIARAAAEVDMPCVVSFTVETDGRLPTGQPLGEAINEVDAMSGRKPAYYMINCAHPDHFRHVLSAGEDWTRRIHGLRANASRMSHAELDVAEELDDGNPQELGTLYGNLLAVLPNLNVFGGCCGTDHRHVSQMCHAVAAA